MSLQEAQQFVAHFITGEYAPGDYEAFLGWLKGATIEELNTIVDVHESLHEDWILPAGPAPEWIIQLERKLDKSGEKSLEEAEVYNPELEVIGEWEEDREEMGATVTPMRLARSIRRNSWIAAASVIVLLSAGTYVYIHSKGSATNGVGSNKQVAGLTRIFFNPRGGGQKEVVLEDGSKIWLNASSTLRCPPQFTVAERLVELSGEAYFEVAANTGDPFRVLIRGAEVDVLGTGFNVMAYDDEPASRTTLIEGAVKVSMNSGSDSAVLRPGQQVEIPYPLPGVGAKIKIISNVDPENVLSWRKGYFQFKNTGLRTILRTLSRAYNVDIQYAPNVPDPEIGGIIDKKLSLEENLETLQSSLLNISLKKDGKTVIVTST